MIFKRSTPTKNYKDYTLYRSQLRKDFNNRCAYCLMHEYPNGGEANFEIDHHRPQNGPYARPDLASDYNNLYWSCRECNSTKGDEWPDDANYAAGFRFIDPCEEWGDHERNWISHPDGTLEPLTNEGRYTVDKLKLWRAMLKDRRAQMFTDRSRLAKLEDRLQNAAVTGNIDNVRLAELTEQLQDLRRRLEPPVYNRPRRGDTPPQPQSPQSETST